MKTILQISKFYHMKGGSETAYFGLSYLLQKNGHTVIPFAMKDDRNVPSEYERFFVENVDYELGGLASKISAAGKIIYSFDARNKMSALLGEVKPDLAHFHIFQHQISPSVFGPLKAKGIPLVLTLHDLKPICPNYKMLTHDGICERCKGRKFYHCFLNKCSKGSSLKSLINTFEMYFHYAMGYYQSVDKFIAASNFHRNKMIEFGFPARQIVHIPNFIDTSQFTCSDSDLGYGLYFGRLSDEKGVPTLLKALICHRDKTFYIVGSGPLEVSLKQFASDHNLDNVKFVGYKTGDELNKMIMEASYTVLPSECYENCPMSVLESFAMGKPVIGARIGGIPELINEGVDGMTFESGNADDLAEKMLMLWDSPEQRKTMGKSGREKVEREYNPEIHYERIMSVYHEVCKK